MSNRLSALVAACCLAAPAAFAQRYVPSSEDVGHRHEGLFMRLDAGAGFLKTSGNMSGTDASISGPAGSFGFSIGGNLVENMALFAHLGASVAANPNVTLGSSSASTSDATLNFVSLGGGMNWYLMPANIYLSGMVVMTRLTTTSNGSSGSTDAGFGAKLAIGKEWWVSDHWGLGVAGQFSIGSNADQGGGPTWTTVTPAIAFSASYN